MVKTLKKLSNLCLLRFLKMQINILINLTLENYFLLLIILANLTIRSINIDIIWCILLIKYITIIFYIKAVHEYLEFSANDE